MSYNSFKGGIMRTVNTMLGDLWAQMLKDRKMTPASISALVNRHIDETTVHEGAKKKQAAAIFRDITDKTKSWKSFIYLVVNVMKIKGVTLSLTAEYPDGSIETHSTTLKFVLTEVVGKEVSDGSNINKSEIKK